MSETDLDEEIQLLQEIYIHELQVLKNENGDVECVRIELHPATGEDVDQRYVCMTLTLRLNSQYPDSPPEMTINNPRGVGDEDIHSLLEDMRVLCNERKGSPMLYELIEMAKDSLTDGNIPRCPCMICLEHFTEGDNFTKTPCYHYYHVTCLSRYVKHVSLQTPEVVPAYTLQADLKPKQLVCPVCRENIDFHVDDFKCAPEEDDVSFEATPEMRAMQKTMAAKYERQKANGGIIDVEAEKNKFLVKHDDVVSLAPPPDPSSYRKSPIPDDTKASNSAQKLPRNSPRDRTDRNSPRTEYGRRGKGGDSRNGNKDSNYSPRERNEGNRRNKDSHKGDNYSSREANEYGRRSNEHRGSNSRNENRGGNSRNQNRGGNSKNDNRGGNSRNDNRGEKSRHDYRNDDFRGKKHGNDTRTSAGNVNEKDESGDRNNKQESIKDARVVCNIENDGNKDRETKNNDKTIAADGGANSDKTSDSSKTNTANSDKLKQSEHEEEDRICGKFSRSKLTDYGAETERGGKPVADKGCEKNGKNHGNHIQEQGSGQGVQDGGNGNRQSRGGFGRPQSSGEGKQQVFHNDGISDNCDRDGGRDRGGRGRENNRFDDSDNGRRQSEIHEKGRNKERDTKGFGRPDSNRDKTDDGHHEADKSKDRKGFNRPDNNRDKANGGQQVDTSEGNFGKDGGRERNGFGRPESRHDRNNERQAETCETKDRKGFGRSDSRQSKTTEEKDRRERNGFGRPDNRHKGREGGFGRPGTNNTYRNADRDIGRNDERGHSRDSDGRTDRRGFGRPGHRQGGCEGASEENDGERGEKLNCDKATSDASKKRDADGDRKEKDKGREENHTASDYVANSLPSADSRATQQAPERQHSNSSVGSSSGTQQRGGKNWQGFGRPKSGSRRGTDSQCDDRRRDDRTSSHSYHRNNDRNTDRIYHRSNYRGRRNGDTSSRGGNVTNHAQKEHRTGDSSQTDGAHKVANNAKS